MGVAWSVMCAEEGKGPSKGVGRWDQRSVASLLR